MQQLRFSGMDDGGRLVLVGDDGTRYAVPVDDQLRAALRPRPHAPQPDRPDRSAASPRDVQAMIRAGQTAEDVAASTGWELARVQRFEGPVVAEREHVTSLALTSHVRSVGRADAHQTLDHRTRERLQARGVDLTGVSWDAYRTEHGSPWTVVVAFEAGGRERRAAWHYDVVARSLEALDDEARWLSEDEQSLPGGLEGHPLLGTPGGDEGADLIATMRERSRQRGRRGRRGDDAVTDPAHVPGQQAMPADLLPLEDLPYDPAVHGVPPAAHPRPEGGTEQEVEGQDLGGPTPEVDPDLVDDQPWGVDAPAVAEDEALAPEAPSAAASPDVEAAAGGGRAAGGPGGRPSGRQRRPRERRSLRLPRPKLPALGDQRPEDGADEPEVHYARTHHDPNEVSFDEFFGVDEDELDEDELGEGLSVEDMGAELGDDELAAAEGSEGGDQDHHLVPGAEDGQADDAMETPADPSDARDLSGDEDEVTEDEATEDETAEADGSADQPAEDDSPGDDDVESADDEAVPGEAAADMDPATTAEESATRPAAPRPTPSEQPPTPPQQSSTRRKGRASVPSWDDIMFGSRGPKD